MVSTSARVLVIEDDVPIRSALEVALAAEGYEVRVEPDGTRLGVLIDEFRPDLAILDVRLPVGPDGYALARSLREAGTAAVVFLTAADSLHDRLSGFEAGADDYVVKPFLMAELLARTHALLRRTGRVTPARLVFADVVIDDAARSARRDGQELDLTRTEHELLAMLMRHPRQVLSKHQILSQVWGFENFDENLVEVHMSALRRKLEARGDRLIHTVRGSGYVLRSE